MENDEKLERASEAVSFGGDPKAEASFERGSEAASVCGGTPRVETADKAVYASGLTAAFAAALERARTILCESERILVGAGAGLSTAAGLVYGGDRFVSNFGPFIERYGMTDMYSAGFFPFPTEEDRWAYWARHVWVNRHEPQALPLYRDLVAFLRDRDYFIITTNVDGQFEKAGVVPERLFATQGDYGLLQCARGCHDRLYPNRELVENMLAQTDGTRIPTALVPQCPVCGGRMAVHLRIDGTFVENADWHAASERYRRFVEGMREHPTVLLELGVGWNTPGIIRLPFDRMAARAGARLVRINYDDARIINEMATARGASIQGDIAELWPLVAPPEEAKADAANSAPANTTDDPPADASAKNSVAGSADPNV